tara:strand:+ start:616 stop:1017 length:402 start_codon:yes stop_codon:yes gene_type:complete
MKIDIIIIILTAMFFVSGLDKIINLTKVAKGLGDRLPLDIPMIILKGMVLVAILIEILAPIVIYNSVQKPKSLQDKLNKKMRGYYACLSIVIFTIIATLIYHFPPTKIKYYPFMSNLTTIGGFLLLMHYFDNM